MSRAIAPLERTIADVGATVTLHFEGCDGATRQESYEITDETHLPSEGKLSKGSEWGSRLIGKSLGMEIELPAPEENIAIGTIIDIVFA